MSKAKLPDVKSVYHALEGIFKSHAQVRKAKTIRKILEEHMEASQVKALVGKYEIGHVSKVARDLLKADVFVSSKEARNRLPNFFGDTSQKMKGEDTVLKKLQAKVVAEDVTSPQRDQEVAGNASQPAAQQYPKDVEAPTSPDEPSLRELGQDSEEPPSSQLSLPLKSQHLLLVRIQNMLEHSSFEFAQENMSDVLQKKRWDCVEAMELNKFVHALREHQSFSSIAGKREKSSIEALLASAYDIRHAAVHRLRISTKKTEDLLHDAAEMAVLLGDKACANSLKKLHQDITPVIQQLGEMAEATKMSLKEAVRSINARREELNLLHDAAVLEKEQQDSESQAAAALEIENCLNRVPLDNQDKAGKDLGEGCQRPRLDAGVQHVRHVRASPMPCTYFSPHGMRA